MVNGTTIDNGTTWRVFVDQKLLACGKGPLSVPQFRIDKVLHTLDATHLRYVRA